MDNKELRARVADIIKWDCYGMEPEYREKDGELIVDTKMHALTGSAAADLAGLAEETDRICIFSIKSFQTPTIEIIFRIYK